LARNTAGLFRRKKERFPELLLSKFVTNPSPSPQFLPADCQEASQLQDQLEIAGDFIKRISWGNSNLLNYFLEKV
jgi:hypothetical protein